jgi:hypothetical protein
VAVALPGSTRTERRVERSIMTPPSDTALPATLWPPPRTESCAPVSRANSTVATTSSVVAHRAIRAGRRSTIPLNTRRASS